MTACQNNDQLVPVFHPVSSPPEEVTVEQVLSDYIADEVAAKAKYADRRLLFTNVEVEKIKAIFPDSANDPLVIIENEYVVFRPKYVTDTLNVRKGFVVDIVGEVRGLFGIEDRYLIIENCWVGIVEGDTGSELVMDDY